MRLRLKFILCTFFICTSFFLFTGCSSKENQNVVNVYNWGDYIDKDLISKFEKETGIHVVYSNYTTNEDMYVKLKNAKGAYDLVIPSEYMIERMIREKMVEKLDFSKIPNFKYIDKEYLHLATDPTQEYSVPYFWGTLGIVYDKTKVNKSEVRSWDVLFNPKYKREIVMPDSSRDSIGIALAKSGFSMNSKDLNHLEIAKKNLKEQYPLVYAYLGDQTKDIMKNSEAKLAVMYSGDAVDSIKANPNLAYSIPDTGTNLWFDAMVIPKGAKHYENALKFINFMIEPENMAQNAEYVGYSVPSSEAKKYLSDDAKTEVAYPPKKVLDKCEVFRDPREFTTYYDDLWQSIKNN